jgi:hypothetical protein
MFDETKQRPLYLVQEYMAPAMPRGDRAVERLSPHQHENRQTSATTEARGS